MDSPQLRAAVPRGRPQAGALQQIATGGGSVPNPRGQASVRKPPSPASQAVIPGPCNDAGARHHRVTQGERLSVREIKLRTATTQPAGVQFASGPLQGLPWALLVGALYITKAIEVIHPTDPGAATFGVRKINSYFDTAARSRLLRRPSTAMLASREYTIAFRRGLRPLRTFSITCRWISMPARIPPSGNPSRPAARWCFRSVSRPRLTSPKTLPWQARRSDPPQLLTGSFGPGGGWLELRRIMGEESLGTVAHHLRHPRV